MRLGGVLQELRHQCIVHACELTCGVSALRVVGHIKCNRASATRKVERLLWIHRKHRYIVIVIDRLAQLTIADDQIGRGSRRQTIAGIDPGRRPYQARGT